KAVAPLSFLADAKRSALGSPWRGSRRCGTITVTILMRRGGRDECVVVQVEPIWVAPRSVHPLSGCSGPGAESAATRSSGGHGPRPDLHAALDPGAQHGFGGRSCHPVHAA